MPYGGRSKNPLQDVRRIKATPPPGTPPAVAQALQAVTKQLSAQNPRKGTLATPTGGATVSGGASSNSTTIVTSTANEPNANASVVGITALSLDPAAAAFPIAIGANDPLVGDVTGEYNANTVGAIRGIPVATATPTDGQVLAYVATATQIQFVAPGSPGSEGPNLVYAGPATGTSSGIPTFRDLIPTDLASGGSSGEYLKQSSGALAWGNPGGGQIYPSMSISGPNGTATTFALPYTPINGLGVYADHLRMVPGTDYAWTASSTVLNMVVPPISSLLVDIF